MSRQRISSQEHLEHILLLAGFLIAMSLLNFNSLSERPLVVVLIALLYVCLNVTVDVQAKAFHTDKLLEYATIGLLATVVILSF